LGEDSGQMYNRGRLVLKGHSLRDFSITGLVHAGLRNIKFSKCGPAEAGSVVYISNPPVVDGLVTSGLLLDSMSSYCTSLPETEKEQECRYTTTYP